MSGHRHAALALHSLASSDQESILVELPEPDQRILRDYLAELAELGFDKAANAAHRMDDTAAPLGTVVTADNESAIAEPDALTRLRGATAADILRILSPEPDLLIAQILSLENWIWRSALLGQLSQLRRNRVQSMLDDGIPAAPARSHFLVTALAAQLGDSTPVMNGARAKRVVQMGAIFKSWLAWTR